GAAEPNVLVRTLQTEIAGSPQRLFTCLNRHVDVTQFAVAPGESLRSLQPRLDLGNLTRLGHQLRQQFDRCLELAGSLLGQRAAEPGPASLLVTQSGVADQRAEGLVGLIGMALTQ